jgi:transposase-like protein
MAGRYSGSRYAAGAMNPFVLGAMLGRMVAIKCPYCGFRKTVDKTKPTHHRVCPRCKKHFPDPLGTKRKK